MRPARLLGIVALMFVLGLGLGACEKDQTNQYDQNPAHFRSSQRAEPLDRGNLGRSGTLEGGEDDRGLSSPSGEAGPDGFGAPAEGREAGGT